MPGRDLVVVSVDAYHGKPVRATVIAVRDEGCAVVRIAVGDAVAGVTAGSIRFVFMSPPSFSTGDVP